MRTTNVRFGQKQTFAVQKGMSALPPKADMCVHSPCLLCANSGYTVSCGQPGYHRAARDGGHGKFCGKITE